MKLKPALTALTLAIAASTAARSATFTVDMTGMIPGSVLSIDLALALAASDGDAESTILLAPGWHLSAAGIVTSPVKIKPLVPFARANIKGPLVFWAGAGGSQIERINFSTPFPAVPQVRALVELDIDDCQFDGTGTSQTTSGGAIESQVMLTITNSTISNYSVDGDGGGILVLAGDADVQHVAFESNAAAGHGGGLAVLGSAMVSNCTFTGNSASRGGGGYFDPASDSHVEESDFTSNTASIDGGGLWGHGDATNASIDCTYTSNTASERGGGAYLENGAQLRGGFFLRNEAQRGGGAAVLGSGSMLSKPSGGMLRFEHNSASTRGGGLFLAGDGHEVRDAQFELNSALAHGAGLFVDATEVHLEGLSLIDNRAFGNGGGASMAPGSSSSWSNCEFWKNISRMNGGGLHDLGTATELKSCFFKENIAIGDGGGLRAAGLASLAIEETSFEANRSTSGNGGGMHVNVDTFTIQGGTLVRNRCDGSAEHPGEGGGIRGTWTDGTCTALTVVDNDIDGFGAGIWIKDSPTTLSSCILRYNDSGLDGGALYAAGNADVEMLDCEFFTNSTLGKGGGAYFDGAGVYASNTRLLYNNADFGGGICGRSMNLLIEDSNCLGNSALDGGAIFADGGATQVMNTMFTMNFAQRHGGSIAASSANELDVENSSFAAGSANDNGGALYVLMTPTNIRDSQFGSLQCGLSGGALFLQAAPTRLENVTMNSCQAGTGGALAAVGDMQAVLVNASVMGCTAGEDGGGIAFFGGAELDATSITVSWCIAGYEFDDGGDGGGLWVKDGCSLTNAMITNNAAMGGSGGGLYSMGQAVINASTISSNEAFEIGGILAMGGSLTNSICWGNLGIDMEGLAPTYSCVEGGGGSGEGVIDENPMFMNPDINDFRLSIDSTLVDAGLAELLPMDLQDLDADAVTSELLSLDRVGAERVRGGEVDMGAREGNDSGCLGDFNGDSMVNVIDLLLLLSAWESAEPCPQDLDGNGTVDFMDVLILLSAWGDCDME